MTEAKKPDNVEVLREKATKKHEEKPAKPEGKVVKTIQLDPSEPRSVVKVKTKGGEWDKPEHAPVLEVAAPDMSWPPTQDNSPQVVVRGQAVEPVNTITYNGEKESITHKDITFYLPWPVERFRDMQLSIYELEEKGRKIYLAMDSLSKFVIEKENQHCFFIPGNGQLQPNSIVVMVNASSANDYFVGESSLINVESRNNVVNNSHLEANRKDQGNQWLRFLEGVEKDSFKVGEHRRHSYSGCRFKRTRVENSLLGDGYYLETHLADTEIRSNGRVDVRGGRISRCRIVGSDIFLDNASLNTTTIDCSGSVRINRMSMNSEHFRTSGLYLNNKFGYTTITAPHWADLRFVRVSLTDFELSDGVHTATLKLGEGIHNVSEEIENLFNRMKGKALEARAERNRFDSAAPDSFTRSILRYIVDSVMSRLRVIEMIDSASTTLESVAPSSNRYDPYATPFDL